MELNAEQKRFIGLATSWKFAAFLLFNLPLALLAGIRVKEVTDRGSIATVPMKWLNKNPFRSMYFAVQCMTAEISTATTAMAAVKGQPKSIAHIVVGLNVKFMKKATSRVFFTCENGHEAFDVVAKCLTSEEPETCTLRSVGRMQDGTVVAEVEVIWSFKQRAS